MNFIYWLLQRIKRTIFRPREWEWVSVYRRMILREKVLSIILTFLVGMVFVGVVVLVAVAGGSTRESASQLIDWSASAVVSFYLYNWLAALYEVYTTEKMATWHALKDE